MRDLFHYFLESGVWMEDNLEFYPNIRMKNVYVNNSHPTQRLMFKMQNPYIWSGYIQDKSEFFMKKVQRLEKAGVWQAGFNDQGKKLIFLMVK